MAKNNTVLLTFRQSPCLLLQEIHSFCNSSPFPHIVATCFTATRGQNGPDPIQLDMKQSVRLLPKERRSRNLRIQCHGFPFSQTHARTRAHRHTQDACNQTADLLVLRHSDAGLTSHLALLGAETLRCQHTAKIARLYFSQRCSQIRLGAIRSHGATG